MSQARKRAKKEDHSPRKNTSSVKGNALLTRIRVFLAPPVFPDDEEKTRQARLLNALSLSTMLVLLFVGGIAVPFVFSEKLFNSLAVLILVLMLSLSYYLMRAGRVRFASALFTLGFWLVFTLFLPFAGGTQSVAAVFYIVGVVIAGLLLGTRGALINTVACCVAALGMVLLNVSGHALPRLFPISPIVGWVDISVALAVVAIVMNISVRNLREALALTQQRLEERQQAENDIRHNAEELSALYEMSKTVSASLSLEHLATVALDEILKFIPADLAYFFLREGEQLILNSISPESYRKKLEIPEHHVGECICGLAVIQGKALYSRDISTDARCTWEECKKVGFQSFAALPLWRDKEIIGILGLASINKHDFKNEAEFLETLANQISGGLQNTFLYEKLQFHAMQLEKEIAERKQAEMALRESEERYQKLVSASPDGITIVGLDGRITYVSAIELELHGEACSEDVIGHSPLEWITPADRERASNDLEDTFRRVDTPNKEFLMLRKDGATFWGEIAADILTDASGQPIGIIAITRDITERKKAEDQIRDALNYANTLIENSPVGIVTFKATGEFISANQALLKMVGATWEMLRTQNFRQIKSWKDSGILTMAEEALTSGEGQTIETYVVSTFDKSFWCSVQFTPFQYEGETRLLVVMNDITERKQAEEVSRRTNAALAEAQRISHLGSWDWDVVTDKIHFSDEMFRLA